MYEEVDERYQEKRRLMMQVQNSQLEDQFHRHLLAAFNAGANSTRQQTTFREKGVPALRLDVPSQAPNFWPSLSTPPPSAGLTPSFASNSSSHDPPYLAQPQNPTPSCATVLPNNYIGHHQVASGYLSPSMSPRLGASMPSRRTSPGPVHATVRPGLNRLVNDHPFRGRFASLPENALNRTFPMTTVVESQVQDSDQSEGQGSRAQSEPLKSEGELQSSTGEQTGTAYLAQSFLSPPGLCTTIGTNSPSPLSSSPSSSSSFTFVSPLQQNSAGDQIFLSPGSMEFVVSPPGEASSLLGYDAEFHDFNQYANTLGNITRTLDSMPGSSGPASVEVCNATDGGFEWSTPENLDYAIWGR